MPGVIRRRIAPVVVALALGAVACGGSGEGVEPSGALGPVSQEAADRAVGGLCEIVGATDLEAANATFQDRAHQTLHTVAAAAEQGDRAAAAALLQAKQRVEADLTEAALPVGFGDDVEALLASLRAALGAIGLDAATCGP
jgi:hypothetical protein